MNYIIIKDDTDITTIGAILIKNGYKVWVGKVTKGKTAVKALFYEENI